MRVSSGIDASLVFVLAGFLVPGALGGCGDAPGTGVAPEDKGSLAHIRRVTAAVDDAALRDADARPGDWLSYGRNYREDRYSPLDRIHRGNVAELGLAWTLDLGTKRGIQATPLVVDGIMFLSGPWSVVYAVDTRKGELIWEYDPGVDRGIGTRLCCGVSNRGLALYEGALFVGTLDGRLISIDAADGTPNWEVMTVDPGGYQSITGAPRIANGLVLIGNGGAEFTARGYVSAYRADTGELAWRFYTVPGNPDDGFEHPDLEQAAATWTGSWWELGGGGTAWDSIAYDPELDRVYIGDRQRHALEPAPPQPRGRGQSLPLEHRGGGGRHRPLSLALPDDTRATPGTTPPRSTSCRRISPSTAQPGRCWYRRRRTASSMFWTVRRVRSSAARRSST